MSRLTSNTYAAASPRARKIRSVHPIRPIIGATGALLLSLVAGCAQLQIPPPDAPAARLPQTQDTPALTDAQKQDLTRLNKRIYDGKRLTRTVRHAAYAWGMMAEAL